jgi:hypothetical protein
MENFYRSNCLILEELIHFIEQHLPAYFDNEATITSINAELAKKHLLKELMDLQPIAALPTMDTALYSMSVRPIRQFINEENPTSYRELKYLKELARCLKQLTYLDTNADVTYELHLILMQLNFNHSRYVLHHNYWLDAQISAIPDRMKRLDELSWHIQAIEQMEYNPDFTLNPKLLPLKEQLLNSIKATYQFLLTEDKPVNHAIIEQIETKQRSKAKIRLSVSVPVLALFLKILIKAGIILNESRNEVFRIIVDNFTTVKSDRLSYGSLKGKYNKTPPSAYLSLKGILIKLIDKLREV